MSFVQNTLDIQCFLNSHGCVIEAVLLMYGVYATWKWALPIRCTSICDRSCQREMTISWWCLLKNILVRTYIRERDSRTSRRSCGAAELVSCTACPLTLSSQRASATVPHPGLDPTISTGFYNIRTVHVLSLFLHFGARASRINS
jgi:hypothetical protein